MAGQVPRGSPGTPISTSPSACSPSSTSEGWKPVMKPESPSSTSDNQPGKSTGKTDCEVPRPLSILSSIMLGEPENIINNQAFGKQPLRSSYEGGVDAANASEKPALAAIKALLLGQGNSDDLYIKDQLNQMCQASPERSKDSTKSEQNTKKLQHQKLQQIRQALKEQKQERQSAQEQASNKKFSSRLVAMLTRPESPKVAEKASKKQQPQLQIQPSVSPAAMQTPSVAPDANQAQNAADTGGMSTFLHPSYDSMLMSAQPYLRMNTAAVPALPMDEGTMCVMLGGSRSQTGNRTNSAGSINSNQQYDTHISVESPEAPPAKRWCHAPASPSNHQNLLNDRTAHRNNDINTAPRSQSSLRQKRFLRTRQALEKSGLLGITMKTANLMNENKALDNEIEQLRRDTEILMRSIINQQQQHSQNYLLAKYANLFVSAMETS